MKTFKFFEEIPASIYQQAESLNNYSFYHQVEWHQILEKNFGWRTGAYVLLSDDVARAFLPVVKKWRFGVGRVQSSIPLSHKVGVAYKSIEDARELVNELQQKQIALEIHDKVPDGYYSERNFNTVLDLEKYNDPDQFLKSLDYKSCRYMINRSIKERVEIDNSFSLRNFNDFYQLELETRKRLGAPMYPTKFFMSLYDQFQDTGKLSIYIARLNEQAIAGIIVLKKRDIAIYGYGATVDSRRLKNKGGNEAVIYAAIKDCILEGYKAFDFGSTPLHLAGLLKFKEKWNGESTRLVYSTTLENMKGEPVARDGKLITLVASVLKKLPTPIFAYLTPKLLKAAI